MVSLKKINPHKRETSYKDKIEIDTKICGFYQLEISYLRLATRKIVFFTSKKLVNSFDHN